MLEEYSKSTTFPVDLVLVRFYVEPLGIDDDLMPDVGRHLHWSSNQSDYLEDLAKVNTSRDD